MTKTTKENVAEAQPKRRGRPPKAALQSQQVVVADAPKRRGRPPKAAVVQPEEEKVKKETKVAKTASTKKSAAEKKAPAKKAAKRVLPKDMPKIGVVSLGCDKNRVDTEFMLTLLKGAGYRFTNRPEEADAIIINTCCFIKSSRNESEDAILEMIGYKKSGKCKKIVVTGCLPQFDMKSMQNEFPEVDVFIGINEYQNIVKIMDDAFKLGKKIHINNSPMCVQYAKDRITTTPSYLAYLKIADGCNNFCSFCTIPYIRGRYRSRDLESLVEEAESLAARGAKEIILVAQDTTRYGIDLYGKPMIVELLRRLSEIKNIAWIRILYCYPEMVTDELIHEIATNPKVCDYIDVPFQHVSNNVLRRMNRHCTHEQTEELVKKIKSQGKFIAIRTTYMVGFPGETKKDFVELYNFIKHNRLTNVGFFAYSREPGTEAYKFEDQVDEETKNKRLVKLVKLQKKIHKKIAVRDHVGKTYDVICEGFDEGRRMYVGRSQYQAPEIDTSVFFTSREPIMIGEIYKIKIKKVVEYDLEGEKV